jgi:hypothetical protein
VIVTAHAAERYRERLAPHMTLDQATAAISASQRAIDAAADFGCGVVKLGCGGKLILKGETVVTVIARGFVAGHCRRRAA